MKPTLCFAMPFEAEPWLELSKPKLKASVKQIRFYECDDFDLLITGIGAVRMAAALGWLNAIHHEEKFFVNIGLAGAANEPLNSWHEIVKVTDAASGKTVYPEIITQHDLKKSELITVAQAADNQFLQQHPACLIDMEGFAFVMAARHFVPVTHIHLLKFVSDAGFETLSDIEELKNNYSEKIDEAKKYVTQLQDFFEKNQTSISDITELEKEISEKLRLTFSQQVKLKQALRFASFYQLDNNIREVSAMANQKLKHKSERNVLFGEIIETLNRV